MTVRSSVGCYVASAAAYGLQTLFQVSFELAVWAKALPLKQVVWRIHTGVTVGAARCHQEERPVAWA